MKKLTAVAAALALTLAACGGDDGGDAVDTTEATDDTQAASGSDDTEAPAGSDDTEAPAEPDATEAPDETFVSTGNAFCDSAQQIAAAFNDLDDDLIFEDPAAFEEAFRIANDQIQALAANPPSEVAAELQLMADNYTALGAALESVGFDFGALFTDEGAAAVLESMDSAEMDAAGEALDAYSESECGFTIGDSSDSDTGSDDEGTLDTLPDTDFSIPDGEDVAGTIATMYQQMFDLDEAQATCLADAVVEMGGDAESMNDVSAMMDLFADCDISMADLAGAMQS